MCLAEAATSRRQSWLLGHVSSRPAAKRKAPSRRNTYSLMRDFFFGTRKPFFLGMHRFHFLLEASWETVTFLHLFILFFHFFLNPYLYLHIFFCVSAKIFGFMNVSLVWFCLVLWHINHCWLFNAKSSLYIFIRYIGFGLVAFYGISTIIGYLMPNPL